MKYSIKYITSFRLVDSSINRVKIDVKVRIISDLKDFILHELENIKSLSIIVVKSDTIDKIVIFTKA